MNTPLVVIIALGVAVAARHAWKRVLAWAEPPLMWDQHDHERYYK